MISVGREEKGRKGREEAGEEEESGGRGTEGISIELSYAVKLSQRFILSFVYSPSSPRKRCKSSCSREMKR